MGYRYEVVISGVQTEIGISKSHIEQLIIYDADGNDVTESFYLKLDSGTLTSIIQSYISKRSQLIKYTMLSPSNPAF